MAELEDPRGAFLLLLLAECYSRTALVFALARPWDAGGGGGPERATGPGAGSAPSLAAAWRGVPEQSLQSALLAAFAVSLLAALAAGALAGWLAAALAAALSAWGGTAFLARRFSPALPGDALGALQQFVLLAVLLVGLAAGLGR